MKRPKLIYKEYVLKLKIEIYDWKKINQKEVLEDLKYSLRNFINDMKGQASFGYPDSITVASIKEKK
jgi:hypothetical protein